MNTLGLVALTVAGIVVAGGVIVVVKRRLFR